MSGTDINRGTNGFSLTPAMSEEIWSHAAYTSKVMQLSPRIELPGRGLEIQVMTSGPIAEWVAETDAKPISNPELAKKTMRAYKLAFIQLISDEAIRDKRALYDWMLTDGAAAIAKAFDNTVFNGTAPGTGFDDLSSASTISIGTGYDVYTQLVAAKAAVAAAGGDINGFVFDAAGEGKLLGATDQNGRPLFIDSIASAEGVTRLFGAPIYISSVAGKSGTPNVLGIAGDWSKTRYGVVNDISVAISNDATVFDGLGNAISTFQKNMTAIRIEAEVGFIAEDDSYFVRFTDAAAPEPEPGE